MPFGTGVRSAAAMIPPRFALLLNRFVGCSSDTAILDLIRQIRLQNPDP